MNQAQRTSYKMRDIDEDTEWFSDWLIERVGHVLLEKTANVDAARPTRSSPIYLRG